MIGGFNVATQLKEEQKCKDFVGTPLYMAPEVFEDEPLYDKRADIYSIGCVWYELLTGKALEGSRFGYVKK